MKTLRAIQQELAAHPHFVQAARTPACKNHLRTFNVLRAMAFVGDMFDDATSGERLDSVGHFALSLCELSTLSGSAVTWPMSMDNSLFEQHDELDPSQGVAVMAGHLGNALAAEYAREASGMRSFVPTESNVPEIITHLLRYLDKLTREISKHDNLLIVTNIAYEGLCKNHALHAR